MDDRPFSDSKHLIIDGFNVAHSWPRIEVLFRKGLDGVISEMTRALEPLHDGDPEWRVTIVFDGKGSDIDVQRPYRDETFSLVFSPASLSADAVIEQLVSSNPKPGMITVVTRDQAILDSIEANGANGMSPERLEDWIRQVSRRSRSERDTTGGNGEGWGNRLPL